MDHDTLELAHLLCCRAGMLMEDNSALAVAAPLDDAAIKNLVLDLRVSVDRMRALIEAAEALAT